MDDLSRELLSHFSSPDRRTAHGAAVTMEIPIGKKEKDSFPHRRSLATSRAKEVCSGEVSVGILLWFGGFRRTLHHPAFALKLSRPLACLPVNVISHVIVSHRVNPSAY